MPEPPNVAAAVPHGCRQLCVGARLKDRGGGTGPGLGLPGSGGG